MSMTESPNWQIERLDSLYQNLGRQLSVVESWKELCRLITAFSIAQTMQQLGPNNAVLKVRKL